MQTSSVVVAPEAVAERLAAAFGPGRTAVEMETGARLSGQMKPVVQIAPESEEEIQGILKIACAEGWSVSPVGNGSQVDAGNVTGVIDLVIRMHRLNKVVDYSPADLVVTAQPGVLWADLQTLLAEHGQMLPIDPVCSSETTIGGLVATAASGPLRALYGTLRDMTIGLHVVYPDGRVVKTGGKVVKNVAGYDMTKLFVGSYGTLGILSEITFKLRPLPSHRELCLISGRVESATRLASRLIQSNLIPARAEVLSGPYSHNRDVWTFAVECGETEAAAAFQTRCLTDWAAELGLETHVLQGEEVVRFWSSWRHELAASNLIVRFTAPPREILSIGEGVRVDCAVNGARACLSMGATTGVARLYTEGAPLAAEHELVVNLRQRVARSSGWAVLERAPLALRRTVDCFGQPRADIRLMRGIKETIDPLRMMNPGRLVGGV